MKKEKLLLIFSAVLALGAGGAVAGPAEPTISAPSGTSFWNSPLNEGEVTLYTTLQAASTTVNQLQTLFQCVHYDPSDRLTYPFNVRLEVFSAGGGLQGSCTVNFTGSAFAPQWLASNTIATFGATCVTGSTVGATIAIMRIVTTKKAASSVECSAIVMDSVNSPATKLYGIQLNRVGPKLKKVKDTFVP